MSNFVFVLDTLRRPLSPCQPGLGGSLLKAGKVSVFRQFPFTIILNKEVDASLESLELKLYPGSKTTGIAIKQGDKVIFGAELQHRGQQIKEALLSRRLLRLRRRNRKTRYRQGRFLNRTRLDGKLAPFFAASSRNNTHMGSQVDAICTHYQHCSRASAVRFATHAKP